MSVFKVDSNCHWLITHYSQFRLEAQTGSTNSNWIWILDKFKF